MSFKSPEIQPILFDYIQKHSQMIDFDISLSTLINKFVMTKSKIFDKANVESDFISFVINYLIDEKGVNPNKPNENGNYPLELAIINSMNNLAIALLNTNKIDYKTKIQVTSFSKNEPVKYQTYLHLVADKPAILAEFLNRKLIDINVTDDFGNTPLMIACRKKNKDCVLLFFKSDDLDYLHKNNNGKDALMIVSNLNNTKSINDKKVYLTKIIEFLSKSNDYTYRGFNQTRIYNNRAIGVAATNNAQIVHLNNTPI